MALRSFLGSVALTMLAGTEAGRPRSATYQKSPVSSIEISHTMASLAEAMDRLDAHIKAGGTIPWPILETPRSEHSISSHFSSVAQIAEAQHRDGPPEAEALQEVSADVESTDGTGIDSTDGTDIESTDGTGIESTGGVGIESTDGAGKPPPAGFAGYDHFDGEVEGEKYVGEKYKSDEDMNRMDRNIALKAPPLSPEKGTMKTSATLDCQNKDTAKDATVDDLRKCLDNAVNYFNKTVVPNWVISQNQAEKDGEILNLMFDRVLDLGNVKRSLSASNSDETRISGVLVSQAKGLRDRINTLINRGGEGKADA